MFLDNGLRIIWGNSGSPSGQSALERLFPSVRVDLHTRRSVLAKHQSGRFTADETSISHNGNQYLRYYLVEAANLIRRHVPEFKDYYVKKYRQVPKHQHKRALVLTARKFVRLVDALLRKNQIYTPKGA